MQLPGHFTAVGCPLPTIDAGSSSCRPGVRARWAKMRRSVAPFHVPPDFRQLAVGEAGQGPDAAVDALDLGRNPFVAKLLAVLRRGDNRAVADFDTITRCKICHICHCFSLLEADSKQAQVTESDIGASQRLPNQEDQQSLVGNAFRGMAFPRAIYAKTKCKFCRGASEP